MLILALVLLVIPGANALQMDCVPGIYTYRRELGWVCTFWNEGTHCMMCSASITVIG
ncbi:MAG TPA: hypothetical protein VFV49_16365 [Thermoanaerobaculia bacterium]|nr:hypothetical protein [Thermoanaerobaculia bacterium]